MRGKIGVSDSLPGTDVKSLGDAKTRSPELGDDANDRTSPNRIDAARQPRQLPCTILTDQQTAQRLTTIMSHLHIPKYRSTPSNAEAAF
jgi:hypothetical protein